jgi:glycosyltransferase involved in cell wall biosynthesis
MPGPSLSSTSVALCTCDGARYLSAQLESILQQSRRPAELVVIDDCSSDATGDIVQAFAASADFPVRFYRNESPLGIVKNFQKAVSLAHGNYVALADQDDVWLPGKIEALARALSQVEDEVGAGTPILVHTDLRLVAADGELIAPSFFRARGFRTVHSSPLAELSVQNYVTGCASMVNRALLSIALPFPDDAIMHDWWLALVAASCGEVKTLHEATIEYRQHGKNALGAASQSWRRYFTGYGDLNRLFRARIRQLHALEERVGGIAGAGDRVRALLGCLEGKGLGALSDCRALGVRTQRLPPTVVLYLWVLFGVLRTSREPAPDAEA